MQPRQLFVLATLLASGALVSALLPKYPLFNGPQGPVVLGGMALLAALTGLVLRWRARGAIIEGPPAEAGPRSPSVPGRPRSVLALLGHELALHQGRTQHSDPVELALAVRAGFGKHLRPSPTHPGGACLVREVWAAPPHSLGALPDVQDEARARG